ncbi:cytochrome c oxidase subunit II [Hymenobacter sp. DG25A]|jgi:cytochrome c oxidase subunit 2|uniref:cytochrome c oxidase subunit II n=1 Tax=Hymenobacter sp. DG25A TaxID=1385663 RepID=UPI0006BD6FDE|nr:cytochrome c oxidase subunit II [Hymenobacter sp. DG25A]ALD20325.1 cytochrome C oxidase subunit II [Hymenobacter sp. DG25A]
MTVLGILLVLVLLLVVFGLLFRLQILTSIFSGSFVRDVGMSNRVNGILMILFMVLGGAAFAWSFVDSFDKMNPPIASVHGHATERMFWTTMIILGIVFVITQVALFVYSYKYQHKEGRRAFFFPHNNKIEIIWTLIPAIVMAGLVFAGWKEWSKITGPAPKDSVVLEIMGKQFNWLVRYPGRDQKLGVVNYRLIDATNEFGFDLNDQAGLDDFVAGEIHVPKGHPVLLKIRSRDVLHAVYMPHFRVQMYAVPGMPTKFWFTPTKTTDEMRAQLGNPAFNYELACNQICGRGHFAMKLSIVVDEPDDYVAWFAKQQSFSSQNPDLLATFKQKAGNLVEPVAAPAAAAVVPAAKASL